MWSNHYVLFLDCSRRELVANLVHTADASQQSSQIGDVYWDLGDGSAFQPLSCLKKSNKVKFCGLNFTWSNERK